MVSGINRCTGRWNEATLMMKTVYSRPEVDDRYRHV